MTRQSDVMITWENLLWFRLEPRRPITVDKSCEGHMTVPVMDNIHVDGEFVQRLTGRMHTQKLGLITAA